MDWPRRVRGMPLVRQLPETGNMKRVTDILRSAHPGPFGVGERVRKVSSLRHLTTSVPDEFVDGIFVVVLNSPTKLITE